MQNRRHVNIYLSISQAAMLSSPKLLPIPPEPPCVVISEYKRHNKRNFATFASRIKLNAYNF